MSKLELNGITKKYGTFTAVDRVNLCLENGELLTILGPSGCGKSTLLSIIAGITAPSLGSIILNGETLNLDGERIFVPPEKRDIGLVFQNYALWPHMTVEKNISYPLKIRKLDKKIIKSETEKILRLIKLEKQRNRYPSKLSGGEQQRVALGRALIMQPRLLLLDEPMSNLDAKLREEMQYEIRSIQKKLCLTTVHVTHDQSEALAMSDRVAVMSDGQIIQTGTPEEIYNKPSNNFVANFVGSNNIMKGRCVSSGGNSFFDAGEGFKVQINSASFKDGDCCCVIRPENIRFSDNENEGLEGEVLARIYKGSFNVYSVMVLGYLLRVQTRSEQMLNPGDRVRCIIYKNRII
ncbi:MAG: ABC transporter ATP-binding protein [Spirochaetales bacterium]|nr:ABC transporter ATP-binding protein [Spirochaetales bacterium]